MESPGQALSTRPTTRLTRPTRPRGHRGDGPCAGGLRVGHGPRGPGHTVRPQDRAASTRTSEGSPRASAEAQPRCGVTRGGVKRLVKDTRASIETGTRWRHVRWYPTPGSPQDPPSRLTGSASSHARSGKKQHETFKNLLTTLDIGSHSNAALQRPRAKRAVRLQGPCQARRGDRNNARGIENKSVPFFGP